MRRLLSIAERSLQFGQPFVSAIDDGIGMHFLPGSDIEWMPVDFANIEGEAGTGNCSDYGCDVKNIGNRIR